MGSFAPTARRCGARGRGKHEPTVPVVTKEPTKELQVWHKTFDHKNPDAWLSGVKESAWFLECVGTRLELGADDVTPAVSLATLFNGDCLLLGKEDVQGTSCWHVGFRSFLEQKNELFPNKRSRLWRVRAWFDPAADYLPRKLE